MIQNWKQPKYFSTGKWINKWVHQYSGILPNKKNEVLIYMQQLGWVSEAFFFFFLFFKICLFLERGRGRRKSERNINVWLPLIHPSLGSWPTTQACALTRNRTSNPLVCSPTLNPLSYTSQGRSIILKEARYKGCTLYNSTYMNFWKKQTDRNWNQISGSQGLATETRLTPKGGEGTFLGCWICSISWLWFCLLSYIHC